MAIPSGVLENWTKYETAAIDSAKTTHQRIRDGLENSSNLEGVAFDTFLQGSYANTTLIRGSGDVDIVVKLTQSWMSNLSNLTLDEKSRYSENTDSAGYSWSHFKSEVIDVLRSRYSGGTVEVGDKAIEVDTDSLPFGADVVVCMEFRQYSSIEEYPGDYIEGIVFWNEATEERIENFPRRHRSNGESKQEETDGRYKETVRLLKNARQAIVDRGWMDKEVAPSYFIECLLYNVADDQFHNDLDERYLNILTYLEQASIEEFRCQNEVHQLFGRESTQWSVEDAETFIDNLRRLREEY